MKKNLVLVLVLLFVALFAKPPSAFAESDADPEPFAGTPLSENHPTTVHQFIYHIKPDTKPVEIYMNGVVFSIPRNYLSSLYKVRPYTPVSFKIMTFYPDFSGSTTEDESFERTTEQSKKWRWNLSPNLIMILGLPHNDPKQSMQNKYVFEAEANEPDYPGQYGLLKSTKSPAGKIDDVYFRRPSAVDPGVVIFCERKVNHWCEVYVPITSNVEISYKFHPELLPHWLEINQKITKLINSFIVKKEK